MTSHPRSGVSAIVATLGRTTPIYRLLDSLARQTVLPTEIIIVDQNRASLPAELSRPSGLDILVRHLHYPGKSGVSWARNMGWQQASGRWLLFPDDDCWYPKDYIEQALAIARSTGAGIVTGRPADLSGRTINGRFGKVPGRISRRTVLTSQIEWNMLISREAMEGVGGYDENISLGGSSLWQGGEGYDLLLRALAQDIACHYAPTLVAHHEELPVARPDARMVYKGRDYARGLGRVLAVHGFGLGAIMYWTARSCANLAVSGMRLRMDRVRYFAHQAVGRIEGYLGRALPYPPHRPPKDPTRALQKPS